MDAHRHRALQRVFAVAAFALYGAWVHAGAPVTTTVYPTGAFPADMQNVQAALDRGGTVLLKATNQSGQPTVFNFGPPTPQSAGGVNITTDVTIRGERTPGAATTIRGGFLPIASVAPVRSTIQGIDFDGPLDTPIALLRSAGADIVDNRIRNIVPLLLFFGATEVEGIFVTGYDDPQNAITGNVRIADNVIEIPDGDFANGMQFDEVAADIEITGNRVHFLQSNGIVQSLGILVFRSHGRARIADNEVTMGPGDPNAFPAGIFVGGHAAAIYSIYGNTVVTEHPNSDGIDVVGFPFSGSTLQAAVEGNHVVTHSLIPTSGGIAFFGAVKNSLMSANRIEGTSGNAVQILGLNGASTAESNRGLGNDISLLSASSGDVLFGPNSTDNLFASQCGSYVDLGTGNRVLCGRTTSAAPGAAPATMRAAGMSGALAQNIRDARHEATRARLTR